MERWVHLCIDMQRMFAEDTTLAGAMDEDCFTGSGRGCIPLSPAHDFHTIHSTTKCWSHAWDVAGLL